MNVKKTLLSLICCLAILIGCVSGTGMITLAENTFEAVDTIPARSNLLADAPVYSGVHLNDRLTTVASGSVANLTDGAFAVSGTNPFMDYAWKAKRLAFDMQYVCQLDSFLVGSTGWGHLYVDQVGIYVSNTKADLFDSANLVYAASGLTAQNNLFTLETAVTGQFVGFDFIGSKIGGTSDADLVPLGELGAYGERKISIEPMSAVPAETNLVNGLPLYSITNHKQDVTNPSNGETGTAADLTDGVLTAANTDAAFRRYNWRAKRFAYDLQDLYSINKFFVGSSGWNVHLVNKVGIYVSDKQSDLFNAENLVYQLDGLTTYSNAFTLPAAVTGRHVGFDFTGSNIVGESDGALCYLGELGVYGQKLVTIAAVSAVPTDTNLLNGLALYSITNHKQDVTNPSNGETGTAADLTDGVFTAANTNAAFRRYNWRAKRFMYNLGGSYTLTKFLVGSSGWDAHYVDRVAVYVGDTEADLFDKTNLVYEIKGLTAQNMLFTLETAVTGQYVAFDFIGSRIVGSSDADLCFLGELGAYGTPAVTVKTEKTSIVCIGDSITVGHHFPNGGGGEQMKKPYPAALEEMLDAASDTVDYTVHNLGFSGSTVVDGSLITPTDSASSWYSSRWNAYADTIAEADVALIMLGTNDASANNKASWNGAAGNRRLYFKQEYRKLVNAIYDVNSDITIYVMTSPVSLNANYHDILAKDVVPMQLELAAELGLPVIDVYNTTRDFVRDNGEEAFISPYEIGDLRVHPSEEGAVFIAETVKNALLNPTNQVYTLKSSSGTGVDANRVTTPKHNLLNAAGAKVSTNGHENVDVLSDGVLRFVNGNTGENHCTANYIAVDFGASATISQVLLGGCQVSANSPDFLFPGANVFITDDLSNEGAPVYTLTEGDVDGTINGRLITFATPVTGRYMVVRLVNKTIASTNAAWISELAAVGYKQQNVLTSLGAQVRDPEVTDNYALRFAFDLLNNGVKYDGDSYRRDLTDATVEVDGCVYPLVDMGAIISLNDDFGDALTLDDVNSGSIKPVPANNLYEVKDGVVTYTAVVVGIPSDCAEHTLYAAPYVEYQTPQGVQVLYGDMLARSASQVMNNPDI